MKHSIDFFKDEIRNGFYIPTAIKQSWAAQLDVLSEIDRICSKHNIRYFADWGTFLGAVRHGGFVPWDDDLDICMLRDDYNKFREVADQELPQEYVIHDYERQQNHWLFLSRVVNSAHYGFTKEYLDSHYNYPWLAGIDIFVKDYQYRNPAQEKERCDEVMFILAIAEGLISGTTKPDSPSVKANLKKLSDKYSYSFHSAGSERELAISLYHLAELQMGRVSPQDSDTVCQLFPWGLKGKAGEKKEYYDQSIRLPFEDTTIPVPARYNQCLRDRYGDYLVIRKGASAHDYPSFEAQKKLFETSTGAHLPEFTFDTSMSERPVPDKSASIKSLAKECLDGLYTHYNNLSAAYRSGDTNQISSICSDAQQLALDLGTMIEHVRGEKDAHCVFVVKVLEELCEKNYNCYESAAEWDEKYLFPVGEVLEKLDNALSEHILSRKEILFLPESPQGWEVLEPIYREYSKDPLVDAVVLALPHMFKDYYGNIVSEEADLQDFGKDLSLWGGISPISWDTYEIALHCPDEVYYQDPYGNENPCLTIPPMFYAENLRKFAGKLIFVPIGRIAEFQDNAGVDVAVMKYYVSAPGVILSDEVYVQSENIRQRYIEKLTAFAGDNTRAIWEKKISPRPDLFEISPETDAETTGTQTRSNESPRKKMLICIASYELWEHPDNYSAALRQRLELLKENADKIDVSVCIYPNENIDKVTSGLLDEFGLNLIPYPSTSLNVFCQKFDAYYGSASPLVPVFAELKKPVMIANLGI